MLSGSLMKALDGSGEGNLHSYARFTFGRRIDGEEAWDLNIRRHGLGHRNFIADWIDE